MATKKLTATSKFADTLAFNVRKKKELEGANKHYFAIEPIVKAFEQMTALEGSFTMGFSLTSEGTLYLTKGGRFSLWANFESGSECQFTVAGEKLHNDVLNILGGDLSRNFVEEFGSRKEGAIEAFQLILPLLRTVKVGKNLDHLNDPDRQGYDLFR